MKLEDVESQEIQTQQPVGLPPQRGPIASAAFAPKRSRKRNIIVFTVVTVLNVALLALLASQLLTPATGQKSQPGPIASSADSLGDVSTPLLGKMAPAFILPTLQDKATSISLSQFKGQPVILNFWASWCDPCKEETPFLQKSWAPLKAQGVVLIGIDGQDNTTNALKFLQQYAPSQGSYPAVQDTLNGSTAIDYGVLKFPETLFINRHGVIVGKWSGELNDAALKFEMKKLLS